MPAPVFDTVRVAAVQATPVVLDADATVSKATSLLAEAAANGARLAVFPECFVPLYPSNDWAHGAAAYGEPWDGMWEALWPQAVDVPGPLVDRLVEACSRHEIHCAIGINERESERPGTLYNTLLILGPRGVLVRHRKMGLTHHEKVWYGIGDGAEMRVAATPLGRVGGLLCWENRNPLARYRVYRGGPQIWVAPTADDSDGWLALARAVAIESGAFVVSVPNYIPRAAFPRDFPVPLPDEDPFENGGAAIVEPVEGEVIAGPVYGREEIVLADCDLRACLHAKRVFDAVGHYSRADILHGAPPFDGTEEPAVTVPAGDGRPGAAPDPASAKE